jgi:hypothetical protein
MGGSSDPGQRRFDAFMNWLTLALWLGFAFVGVPYLFRSCEHWAGDCERRGGHIEGEIGWDAKCVGAKR